MKHQVNRQVIGLGEYAKQHWKIVLITGFGISSLFAGICTSMVILAGLDYRWAICMSLIAYGFTFIPGGFYVDSRLIFWASSLSVFKQVDESDEVPADHNPIKESSELRIDVFRKGDEVPMQIGITEDQLRDVIGIMFYDTYLTRSSLDSNVWPDVTERWRDGSIQRKLMGLGLINKNNTFMVGDAGSIGRLEVEIEKLHTVIGGVGGSGE